MIISLIAAMDTNKVIGKDNALPWRLPADLARFRAITTGKPVIMGRKTFESIGKPLPDRINIVLTRETDYQPEGVVVVRSVHEALDTAAAVAEAMVIGGAAIFRQFMPLAQKLYLTMIDGAFEGDTRFPEWNPAEWREVSREPHAPDEKNPHPFVFLVMERVG